LGKKEFLLENGTYNKNHEKVKAAKFNGSNFFDPMDIVQVKYELLKEVVNNGKAVTCASEDFGFSRTAYYAIKTAFDKQGVSGLIPEKPGPRKAHKLTEEYRRQIDDYISKNPGASSVELTAAINKNGTVTISRRTVERYKAKKKTINN